MRGSVVLIGTRNKQLYFSPSKNNEDLKVRQKGTFWLDF